MKVTAIGYPTPYIDRTGMTGCVAVQLENHGSIFGPAEALSSLLIIAYLPSATGQPDYTKVPIQLFAPPTLAANTDWIAFFAVPPAMLAVVDPTVTYVWFDVQITAKDPHGGTIKLSTQPYLGLEAA